MDIDIDDRHDRQAPPRRTMQQLQEVARRNAGVRLILQGRRAGADVIQRSQEEIDRELDRQLERTPTGDWELSEPEEDSQFSIVKSSRASMVIQDEHVSVHYSLD
jgi:hypothetical protein